MREKIDDSFREYKECGKKNTEIWRTSKSTIRPHIRERYLDIWREYTKKYFIENRKRLRKKVEWMKKEWKPARIEYPDTYREVELMDTELTEEFSSEPRLYGNIELEENERKVVMD